MKTTKLLISLLFVTFSLFLFNSCKETDTNLQNDLILTSEDDALAENLFDDLSFQADLFQTEQKTTCPTVTITTPEGELFPRDIVIDFGDGCEGSLGRIRKGKILIHQTDFCYIEGAVRTITLEDYYVDQYHLEGTKVITNDGRNAENFLQQTITLTGGIMTDSLGNVATRDAVHVREWIQGEDTQFDFFDNVWRVNGTASGVNRLGNSYTSVITEPLIFDMSCMYKLTQGIISITTDLHAITIDYGDGTCDNEATVTVDGVSNTIQLKR